MKLARLLPTVRDRVYRWTHPAAPWLTPEAIALLEDWLTPEMVGFEWGSGRSTLFFARRVASLKSVEHDAAWHGEVVRQLQEAGLAGKVDYRLIPPLGREEPPADLLAGWPGAARLPVPPKPEFVRYFREIEQYPDGTFDFVLVDGRARVACILEAIPKLKPGGLLILDNAERDKYRLADPWLAGWPRRETSNGLWSTWFWEKPGARGERERGGRRSPIPAVPAAAHGVPHRVPLVPLVRGGLQLVGFVWRHPLSRTERRAALGRVLRWQLGGRLAPGAVAVPFVNDTRLLLRPGMTGATGNLYVGLHEYAEMAFCLHALRPGDLFVDVGANVGAYTVLAAGAVGASCLAVEPVPATFAALLDNVRLNGLTARVQAVRTALGAAPGTLPFTRSLDTINHVATGAEEDLLEVPVTPLDLLAAGRVPWFVKLDVEGYEQQVVAGGPQTLARTQVVIAETAGHGERYGGGSAQLHQALLDLGFTACAYEPHGRRLEPLAGPQPRGNTLYVRDPALLAQRVQDAPAARVHGQLV